MNKKGILDNMISFIVIAALILLFWIYIVNPILNESIPPMLTAHSITGIEAFLWSNISLFFYMAYFIFIILWWQTQRRGRQW